VAGAAFQGLIACGGTHAFLFLIACGGGMSVFLMPGYKKPITCGSKLLRLLHSPTQGRFYEEGSDIVHVQALMLFTRLCGCCCKYEFCRAVGCAAALARTVA